MPNLEQKPPVIIVKKSKKNHTGHHGGAWKVAYADFITSMMAFFLVMWIVGQSADIKKNVAGYFNDPISFGKESGGGILKGGSASMEIKQIAPDNKDKDWTEEKAQEALAKVGEQIKEVLSKMPQFEAFKDQVSIEMTGEGLRIELTEPSGSKLSDSSFFFDVGSAKLTQGTAFVLKAISEELGKLPNHIIIEGHTDSRQYPAGAKYTNWELSADRANAARQLMENSGVRLKQIKEVRGYADEKLRILDNPTDRRNRRISIIVLNEFIERKYKEIEMGKGRNKEI
ncbi:MAG: OmpA family protein [candidate division Zixibacteria bacterium]|nr:OmpA family protein [candidate division Zixibacteria bacterium]